jgi:hypothetical protein
MKKIMYALLATAVLVGGLWVWHAQQSPKMLWSDEDPNYGILRLDILFGLQIGRDLKNDKQLPPIPEEKIAAVKGSFYCINVAAPPDSDIGREQSNWPEMLRPRQLFVDKVSQVLVGGMSRTKQYDTKPELFKEIMQFTEIFGTKTGYKITNMRQSGNRMAYDYLDQFGRERVLVMESIGDGKKHWMELIVFDAKSCVAKDDINKISQPQEVPPELLKAARREVGLE